MKMGIVQLAPVLALLTASASADVFTFQGRLVDAGLAADGVFDFRFRLYDASAGPSQIGPENVVDDVTVTDGLFAVDLNFLGGAFPGGSRWLEIDVKADASGSYDTLSPRQPMHATPYAFHAQTAGTVADGALPVRYTSPVDFNNPANSFAGDGFLLNNLNASNVTSGNLADAHLPLGGSWTLLRSLDVGGGSLFVDPTASQVAIGTVVTQPGFDLSVGQSGVFGAGASRVEIDGSSGDMRGYGPDGLQDWDISATSGGHGQILLWDGTNGNLTAALTARDDSFFAGGELFLGDRDGNSSITLDGDAGSQQAARMEMRNAAGITTVQFDGHGFGDPVGGARLDLMDNAGASRLILDAEGNNPRLWVLSDGNASGEHAIHAIVGSATNGAAVRAEHTGPGNAVHASNFSPGGGRALFGEANTGEGVYGFSTSGIGVLGDSISGWAGYFVGPTTYVSGDLGVGTAVPAAKIDIDGTPGVDGIQFPDDTLQTTAYPGVGAPGTIIDAGFLGGFAGSPITAGSLTWVFVGPTTLVTVDGTQRIVAHGGAPLGFNAGGTNAFRIDVGYQLGVEPISNFAGINYMIAEATSGGRTIWPVSGSRVLPAGTYTIGIVVRNTDTEDLDDNDFVNLSYMVIQE